ncbi:Zinc finger protein, partial [Pseudolycoriella hygida]
MPSEKSKICMVPSCKADSCDVPDRIFFTVPESKRKSWLEIVGINDVDRKQRLFCCENHFSTKKDIVGYHFYKVFGGRIRLCDDAFPRKNLGDNKSSAQQELPITSAEIPNSSEKDEPCDESVDPLATSFEYGNEGNESGADSEREDNGFDATPANSDCGDEDNKFDSAEIPRSEEIIVMSDVYIPEDDEYSDSDDIPLKITRSRKGADSEPPRKKVKKKKLSTDADSAESSQYKCSQCDKNLSSSRSLKRHVKTFHTSVKKRVFTCKECQIDFEDSTEYTKHKAVHKKLYECNVCERTFRTKFLLKSHYVQHVKEKPFLCEICSRPFARLATLRKHRFTHVTEKTFICDTCGKAFSANFLLKQHIHQYHTNNTTVMCAQCSKTFSSTALLNIHIKAYHDEVNPYNCEICNLHFRHPSALLRHRKRFHDPRSAFACFICPKKFTKQEMLERHLKTHPNRPDSLDIKYRIKSKASKPAEKSVFKCMECGISLCRPDRLKAHLAKLHNPDYPFRCPTCRMTFQTELLMTQHAMRLHAPEHEYVFKCYLCPKKYNQEAALKRHVKLHTDPKKPVTCDLCGKTLGRPNRLKPHLRALHNPDNPYKCEICLQTFREQKMLTSHTTQVHEQTISCQYCRKTFGRHEGLQQHIRRNHSVYYDDKEIKEEENVE